MFFEHHDKGGAFLWNLWITTLTAFGISAGWWSMWMLIPMCFLISIPSEK